MSTCVPVYVSTYPTFLLNKKSSKTQCLCVSVVRSRISNTADDMEIEIPGNKITHRMIHNSCLSCIKLGNELQQHVAALDLKRFGNLSGGIRRTDRRTRDSQIIAALKHKVQHRSIESIGEICDLEDILGQCINQVGDRARLGTHHASDAREAIPNFHA